MDAIVHVLTEKGITGVFILALVYAISFIYKQASETRQKHLDDLAKKEQESNELEREFRTHLMSTEAKLMQLMKEHTKVTEKFSENIIRSDVITERLIEAVEKINKKA